MPSHKAPDNGMSEPSRSTATETRALYRKLLRIAPYRHVSRSEDRGFRLPEWAWQKPKQSQTNQD